MMIAELILKFCFKELLLRLGGNRTILLTDSGGGGGTTGLLFQCEDLSILLIFQICSSARFCSERQVGRKSYYFNT